MARLIRFEGRQISVPDDATDDEVAGILSAQPPSAAAASGVPTPPGVARISVTPDTPPAFEGPMQPPQSALERFGENLKIGAQGVGAGLAKVVGMPVDLMTGALNLPLQASNLALGTDFKGIHKPFMGSEWIRERAGDAATAAGAPPTPTEQMTPGQKLGYNISDYGTQFAAPAGPLSMTARAAPKVADTIAGRIGDTLRRPYVEAPARTFVGDVSAGVGAGTAVDEVDNYVPRESPWRPFAEMGAVLFGGGAGAAVPTGLEGIGGMLRNFARNRIGDSNVPVNPQTNAPFTLAETDRAAAALQEASSRPQDAASAIRQNALELRQGGFAEGEMPTAGALSEDKGFARAEVGARTRNSVPFLARDEGVKTGAAERVASMKDPNADFEAPRRVAQAEADTRIGEARTIADTRTAEARSLAEQQVAQAREVAVQAVQRAQQEVDAGIAGAQQRLATAEQTLRDVESQAQQQGAPIAARANTDAKAQASQRLDRALVDDSYIPARTEKNRQFDEAPGRNEELPADAVIAAARNVQRRINDLAPGTLPEDFVQRLRALEPRMVDGENVGGPGTAMGGDLADMRKFLATAYDRAQSIGNFDLADNIADLRRAVNRTIEAAPGYAEANANYTQFADRFRPSPNDEGAKFTRQIDRDPRRGSTPPSATADRFLAGPEKAQALQRMLDGNPNGLAAVREHMLSDFGMNVLNPNNTLNANRAAAWARNNADVLAQFPQLRGEFDGMLANARRGEQLSTVAQANIDAARRGVADTERQGARTVADTTSWANRQVRDTERQTGDTVRQIEKAGQQRIRDTEQSVERSAAGTLLREDPRDVAQRLLGTKKYGANSEIDEINKLVANDPAAQAGWRGSVAEVLADRVTGTRQIGEAHEVHAARLAKEFKENEQLLANTMSPEQMNTLRQVHKLLGHYKNLDVKATTGSNTADKQMIPGWLQLATRHVYGDLKGGGIIKRFKLLMEQLPSNRSAAEEVVNIAWFNPDVAAYLLEKKLPNNAYAPYNIALKRLEATAAGARETTDEQ